LSMTTSLSSTVPRGVTSATSRGTRDGWASTNSSSPPTASSGSSRNTNPSR
jgi:hypothetical protein